MKPHRALNCFKHEVPHCGRCFLPRVNHVTHTPIKTFSESAYLALRRPLSARRKVPRQLSAPYALPSTGPRSSRP